MALTLSATHANAQEYLKPIDSIVKLYQGKEVPGFAVLVSKNGKTLFSRNAGYANLEKQERITDKTVFSLASTSKQFTAACIILLQQQGKLNLEDNLRKYMPEFPAYAEKITINQMLNHTAGLKDYRALAMLRGDNSDNYSSSKIKEMLLAQELNYEPGAKWSYSNTGYWCLAQIVEKVSGQTIGTFARKNIFRPLSMKNTRYVIKPNNDVKNAAVGYQYDGSGYNKSDVDEYAVGGAGVYSTAEDLQKWLAEMETHRTFGDAFWNTMMYKNPAKGKGFTYTKGLFNFKYANRTMISHGGDVVGFHPITAYFPNEKIGVVLLSNDDDFKRYVILGAAADILIGDTYEYPKAKTTAETRTSAVETISIEPSFLESYAGNYELAPGYVIAITAEEGKLRLTQLWDGTNLIVPPTMEKHHFEIEGADLGFGDFEAGKATQLRIITSEEDSVYRRMFSEPDFTLYDKYAGMYYCEGLKANITFFTDKGILRYRFKDAGESYIASPPEDEGVFATSHGKITFHKNDAGAIAGFILDHERALGMSFLKTVSDNR